MSDSDKGPAAVPAGVDADEVRPLMRLFALTGGIGSGKSSVASRLAARGAVIVDSDEIVRGLQAPGAPVLAAMVARFGASIVDQKGELIRPAVAQLVFNDPEALKDLNAIVHPAVRDETTLQTIAAADGVVIQDIPLLVETLAGRPRYSGIIVVDIDPELAVQRLIEGRGFTEADARARISKQANRQQRLDIAGFVVDNSGTVANLDAEVERCWTWMQSCELVPVPRPPRPRPAG